MISLVKEEIYKLVNKKSTIAITICLLVAMTGIAIITKVQPKIFGAKMMFDATYTGLTWVVLVLIAACGTIIAMEFQYGTIKEVLYRQYYRGQVIVSKWITMLLYSLYLFILTFVYSIILKFVLFNDKIDLSKHYGADHSLLVTTIISYAGQFVSVWLILSLVLLLANLFKSNAAAISIGIIGYFALSMVSQLMTLAIHKWNWLKWNPLNMMNLGNQVVEGSYKHLTYLSTTQLTWGCLAYTAIFLFISYVVFKKRSV
ncbi:ABC transporter permease [Lentilactobacillus curieae]|uniref:ABC transporter permease n=1 Tax=Lentilactobacillus curieae TaxID=1138822 RepID=A0A1S6QIQ0_9LACO|nr:ABC transporter permease [Lentilactobacillus curieae]AQW21482.1 ABC transporter permease [Lentilactobacillus curieae]